MTQTKADRQEAARKAAATRKQNEAEQDLKGARGAARGAVGNITGAAKLVGDAAVSAGKAVAARTPIGRR